MSCGVNLQKDLEMLARRGRIVIVGGSNSISIMPALILGKEAIVTGVKLADSTTDEWNQQTAAVHEGLQKGWLRPVLDKEYPLADAAKVVHNHAQNS